MPAPHPRPWHRDSVFGDGPRVALDRNARARFLYLCRLHRAPGRLSAGGLDVATALLRLLGQDGRLAPSHATLAALAAVHVATVQRALDRLWSLGLLRWTRRLVRDAASGWRAEQTSNAYWLTPERETPAFACDLQTARAVKLVKKRKAAVDEVRRAAPEDRDAATRALATIAARRMAKLGLA